LQAEQRRADLLDERARIAREIHDVLAHSLGALGIQIQAARSVLHKDADQASDLLAAAQQMAAEGLVETRRAVQALRTDTLPIDEELATALTSAQNGFLWSYPITRHRPVKELLTASQRAAELTGAPRPGRRSRHAQPSRSP
jgi:signal transduction histidine kinase